MLPVNGKSHAAAAQNLAGAETAKKSTISRPAACLWLCPSMPKAFFATGEPVQLFQIHGRAPISSTDVFTYDVTKDGKRFLVNRYVKPEHVAPLTILLNVPAS
jgi:hypothetical protein